MGIFGFGKKEEEETIRDFSEIDTMQKAKKAAKKGILKPLYLISPLCGGAKDALNTLYVPPAAVQQKDRIDNMLFDAVNAGKTVKGFSCSPQYKGSSFVPSSIRIVAGGDVDVDETIEIW